MTDERPGTPCDSVLERAVDNLSKAVRFETISDDDPSSEDAGQFESFHAFLEDAYPLVHSHLEKEVVGEASLLYTWPGGGPEARPVVLAALEECPSNTTHPWQIVKNKRIHSRNR